MEDEISKLNINSTVLLHDGSSLIFSHQPSFTQVLRDVRRQEHSIFNCIASILHDAQFVTQVVQSHQPQLPVFPNLRCGLWYIDPQLQYDTAYFKSTDGHTNQWNFSTTRLNLNVAKAAAKQGGAFIVDATRRGKRFPDALSKTVPIWAAVINRALSRHREDKDKQQQLWNDVHLPPWIESTEKDQIYQKIDEWVAAFLSICPNIDQLASLINKPLRCFWVCQEPDWQDHLPSSSNIGDTKEYIPLILVSAAVPNTRTRRRLQYGNQCPPNGVMYEYVPGAGDDEESWSKGLTPALLWSNYEILLDAGVDGVEEVLEGVLQRRQQQKQRSLLISSSIASPIKVVESHEKGNSSTVDKYSQSSSTYKIGSTGLLISSSPVEALEHVLKEQKRGRLQSRTKTTAIVYVGQTDNEVLSSQLKDYITPKNGDYAYLWVPIPTAKNSANKWALLQSLSTALPFISTHLEKKGNGEEILCDSEEDKRDCNVMIVGEDDDIVIPGCIALAALLACFNIKDDKFMWAHPCEERLDTQEKSEKGAGTGVVGGFVPAVGNSKFTRTTIRQYLSILAGYCPRAVPNKGLLRQVFNAFVPHGMVSNGRVAQSDVF